MRLRIAILLILALILAPLGPVQAGWSCPDGTPCVQMEQSYRCASDHCSARSCCENNPGPACRHGAYPAAGASNSKNSGTCMQGADHCRFIVSTHPDLAAVQTGSKLNVQATQDALLLPALVLLPPAVVSGVFAIPDTCGYRPPPLLLTGPTRAPPTA